LSSSCAGQRTPDAEPAPTGRVEFRVLGPLEVRLDGVPITIGASKQRTLLAALLLRPGQVLSVGQLASRIWSGGGPADPRGALQAYMMRLRRALCGAPPDLIRTAPTGYLADVTADQLDLLHFRDLLDRARRLIDPADGWAGLAAEPGGAGVLAAWRQRAAAVRAYGGLTRKLAAAGELTARVDALVGAVLHMHHNRLVGIDRPAEERSYAIARGAIVAHRDRARVGT